MLTGHLNEFLSDKDVWIIYKILAGNSPLNMNEPTPVAWHSHSHLSKTTTILMAQNYNPIKILSVEIMRQFGLHFLAASTDRVKIS